MPFRAGPFVQLRRDGVLSTMAALTYAGAPFEGGLLGERRAMNLLTRNSDRIVTVTAAILVCLSYGVQTVRADVVTDWNATAAALPIPGAPDLARAMAAMHGAMHDALNAIEPLYETYRFSIDAPAGASKDAAAATAAHHVLTALVPTHTVMFDRALATSLAAVPEGRRKLDGIAVGMAAAQAMLGWRATVNADSKRDDQVGIGPAAWQEGIPLSRNHGALPALGGMAPFLLESAASFRAEAPPAGGVPRREMDEVKILGGRYSTSRTAEQTAVAIFWAGNELLLLNAAARSASQAKYLSMHENARLFALLHMASADAAIVAFNMRLAGDGPPAIELIRTGHGGMAAAPDWEPLLNTLVYSPHHCIVTGAAVQLLREHFGFDQIDFEYISPGAIGMKRGYESFWQIATEMEDAQVWAGIQFRSIAERSTELGRKIGARAIASYMRPL
jgi:hypothetical protein